MHRTARLIWLHALAVGYAPRYLEENGDAIRNGWPRVPLPASRRGLEESANLAERVAALLDIDVPLPGLDSHPIDRLRTVATIKRTDGKLPGPQDLLIRAGWGIAQTRTQKSGALSRLVMPGDGSLTYRSQTPAERAHLTEWDRTIFGDEVVDVYLNESAVWTGIPLGAWSYKIGGYQVLRKWLSYREHAILERGLTVAEARHFQSMARRLAELVRLEPELNLNYLSCIGAVDQDPLPLPIAPAPRP